MLKMIVRQPRLKLHSNHFRIRLLPKLRATSKSTPHQLLTTGFTITFSAFWFLAQPPHVSAIEVDRGQLEWILTREFETRVHRASDAELLKLLQQLSMPRSLDFPAPEESTSILQNIIKPIKKQEIKPTEEQDFDDVKEQEIKGVKEQETVEVEKQDQDLFQDLTFQTQDLKQKKLNFGLDVNRLQKALRYALAGGIAISVFLFGLRSIMTQEQDSTETSEEETEPIPEQQEEDQSSAEQTPTDGVLWRRSGVQTDSIEDQSFEVEWQDASVEAEQVQDCKAELKEEITENPAEAQKQDPAKAQKQILAEAQEQDPAEAQEQDPVEVRNHNEEQDHEDQDQEQEEEIMIAPPLPQPDWKASGILSNVDSNHSATLLPNILRLSKRE